MALVDVTGRVQRSGIGCVARCGIHQAPGEGGAACGRVELGAPV